MSKRFTASRVPDSGIEVLFGTEERWQAWLAVESALALTQADLEMIPREAADAITAACRIERLDLGRIREGIARISHPLMQKWAAGKARGGRISEWIRNRRATQPPAHFQPNPLGRVQLAVFPRCSLLTF